MPPIATHRIALFAALAAFVFVTPNAGAEDRYEVVEDFFQLPDGPVLGPTAGVAIDSQGRIIVSHRGPRPILVFDSTGRLVHAFGDDYLPAVHGTRVDAEDNIWVTDITNHTMIKFSPEGKVLLVLGQPGTPGDDERHFNRPTDVAFGADGDFFVSDGYGNSRIVKFDKEGNFIKAWGSEGAGTGQFDLPHNVFVDGQGLLHVSDRENDRIQVFDQDGNYIRQYGGFAAFGMYVAKDQTLYVADGRAHQALHMTLEGEILSQWGSQGSQPGQMDLPHGIAVDKDRTVYVTEITGQRIQKFVQKADE